MAIRIDKFVLVVLAIATTGVGLYSHYSSDWVKTFEDIEERNTKTNDNDDVSFDRPYDVCKEWPPVKYSEVEPLLPPHVPELMKSLLKELLDLKCPKIVMERFFVGVIITALICSVISLALSFVPASNSFIKFGDIGLNIIVAVLLLASGIVYIVDAEQIRKIVNFIQDNLLNIDELIDLIIEIISDIIIGGRGSLKKSKEVFQVGIPDINDIFKQRHGAKVAAGALAILQSIIHLIVAGLGFRGGSKN